MFDLKKIFRRGASAGDPDSDYHPSDKSTGGLQVEYQGLIANQLRRLGISPDCTTVEVRKLGQAPDGYDVFAGMVRLSSWERDSALRLLLGLPILEARMRKTVSATWLADYSHFAGLWLHASERLNQPGELQDILGKLVPVGSRRRAGQHRGSDPNRSDSSLSLGPSSLSPSSGPRSEPDEQLPVSS